MTADFEASTFEKIREMYKRCDYQKGWSLFYSLPKSLLQADIVFIGMNPGGNEGAPATSIFADECPYTCQRWKGYPAGEAPLQKQVQALFKCLHRDLSDGLCGNLVPFRSRDWKNLRHSSEAQLLGEAIWRDVFDLRHRPVTICMGRDVEKRLSQMLDARHIADLPVGWGETEASQWAYAKDGVLIRLPHLSRYRLFHRGPKAQALLDKLLLPAVERLQTR